MLLDRALGHPQQLRDPGVGASLGHQLQDLALTRGQCGERVLDALRGDELPDQRRVDDAAAGGDPLDRLAEVIDLGDPAFEQVTDPVTFGQQVHRPVHLDVGREHEDRDLRELGADRLRRLEPLGRVRRRHPDVEHHQVRRARADEPQQLRRVSCQTGDFERRPSEQAGDALAQQDIVVGDHHPNVLHDGGRHSDIRRARHLWVHPGRSDDAQRPA